MRIFFLLMLFLPCLISAQVEEHFDDGDFTQNPSWTGDTGHFKVSSSSAVPANQRPALQLDAPQAGQSCLSFASAVAGAMEWRFWVKLSMNTSPGNFARVYLCSDQEDLKSPLKGFFVQLGGAGDSVSFFRQDSLEMFRLVDLDTLYTGNSTNAIRMRVIRETDGAWHFYADPSGGQSLIITGSVNDTTTVNAGSFGFFCQYTSSNASKFYFDDIYAGPMVIDTITPELISLEIPEPDEIRLYFSEPVSETSAGNVQHYELLPGIGNPNEAIRMLEPDQVHLFFDQGMESGFSYTLTVRNIEDQYGNISTESQWPLFYYEPRPWDVIITEIMADPSPVVSLPEYEYLELHNRCAHKLNLSGWKLTVGSSVHVLPPLIMDPDSYALITGPEGAIAFVNHGNVTALGSFGLPNSGAAISLADPAGKTIAALRYDPSWYRDDSKSDGGWSLEMSDISNPCKDDRNWKASQHPAGGTPGRANLFPLAQDEALFISGIRIPGPSCAEVIFSQVPDSLCATHISQYRIDPPILQVVQAPLGFDDKSLDQGLFDKRYG